jgi:tyrosine-protein kinase Etk/Wzc
MNPTPPPAFDLSFLRGREAAVRVAKVTAGFLVAGLLFAFLAPRWYRSSASVVPVKAQKGSGIASLLSGDLGALAAGLDSSLGGGTDSARIAAVLKGTAVSDAVIRKFGLQERYGKSYVETTRDALWRHCDVKIQNKPNLVEMSCEDEDPKFAQAMLAHFVEHGNEVFRRVSLTSATEEVKYLERRVVELRRIADDVAERMRTFQEKHQIVDLESQAKAVVSSVATLNAQKVMKQLELDYARRYAAGDEPSVRQLESQLSVVDEKLLDMELPREPTPGKGGAGPRDRRTGLFPAALSVPALRAEYEKLYRDRKVAEATLVFALDRLEGARTSEARDVSTFQVLDPPTLPTKASWPDRPRTMAVALVLGLAAGVAWQWWVSRKRIA